MGLQLQSWQIEEFLDVEGTCLDDARFRVRFKGRRIVCEFPTASEGTQLMSYQICDESKLRLLKELEKKNAGS